MIQGDAGKGVLTIRLGALARNFRRFAASVAPARLAAVVKADAYGLGAVPVAAALASAGCRHFFVAHLDEAIAIRAAFGPEPRLYVLNGLAAGNERACADAGIVPVINSREQALGWIEATRGRSPLPPAALQLDSGMSRLGLSADELAALVAAVRFDEDLRLDLVMTHLACADEPANPANSAQLLRFEQLAATLPPVPRSIANSGGAFLGGGFPMDLVRSGLALYGCLPNERADCVIEPVVGLTAPVIQLRDLGPGEGVGYGLSFRSPRPSRLATLAIGYADGWPRHLGNRGAAYRGDARLPIVGRVSMDSLTVEVTMLRPDPPEPGEQVELIGPRQSLDDVARDADTIPYEILTRLGRRFVRQFEYS